MLSTNIEENNQSEKSNVEKMKELVASESKKSNRALFSGDTAKKILNHQLKFKLEDEE